jgi:hypothetical protein
MALAQYKGVCRTEVIRVKGPAGVALLELGFAEVSAAGRSGLCRSTIPVESGQLRKAFA